MSENIEAEVRLLVRQISELAARAGGTDRPTYDALFAASAALTSKGPAGESRGREEVLRIMRARLKGCEAEPYVRAA